VPLGPDDGASRYDAAWLPGRRAARRRLRARRHRDLEVIDAASGTAAPLTRVTSGVQAPAPSPADGSVFFLRLHARGLNLHRVHADSVALDEAVALPTDALARRAAGAGRGAGGRAAGRWARPDATASARAATGCCPAAATRPRARTPR
jgi:hypothetical protein